MKDVPAICQKYSNLRTDQSGDVPQVRQRGIKKALAPEKVVIVVRPLIPEADGILPDLFPTGLMAGIAFIPRHQAGKDGPHQGTALLPVPVLILRKKVLDILAGDGAKLLSFPPKEAVLGLQDCTPGDVYHPADTIKPGTFPGNISAVLHVVSPPLGPRSSRRSPAPTHSRPGHWSSVYRCGLPSPQPHKHHAPQ